MNTTGQFTPFRGSLIALAVTMASVTGSAVAAGQYLWYKPTAAADGCQWSNGGNWRMGDSSVNRMPTDADAVELDSASLPPTSPLTIAGCDAVCKYLALSANEFSDDGRVVSLRIEDGATLRTKTGILLTNRSKGMSQFTMAGGTIINDHGNAGMDAFGGQGRAVVTNENAVYQLVCTNGTAKLALGKSAGSFGEYVQNGGRIERVSDSRRNARVYVGYSGTGRMTLNGGTVDCSTVIGSENSGDGTLTVNGGEIFNKVTLAAAATATGRLVLNGGTVNLLKYTSDTTADSGLRCGYKGKGVFEWNGGLLKAGRLYIGCMADSSGVMDMYSTDDSSYINELFVGGWGSGTAAIKENAKLTVNWLKVGTHWKYAHAPAVLTIGPCATLTVKNRLELGGFLYRHPDDDATSPTHALCGVGTLVLKGGDLSLVESSSGANSIQLYVGRQSNGETKLTDSYATIRGWGRIMGATYSANTMRMQMGLGQIIGDGEGDEHLLDLTPVINIKNEVTNPADGTNGWYAVNKGAVHYPRTWFAKGTGSYCFGTDKAAEAPDFVNSMRFSITTAKEANFRGGLYAADRTDLHLDTLPSSHGIVDVWKVGIFDKNVDGNPVAFSDLSLSIRYDQTKVAAHDVLKLYRYANGRWTCVSRTTGAESAATHTISTSVKMSSDSSQSYNGGILALVKCRGFVVVFH